MSSFEKSIFYNPMFRVFIFIAAWVFLKCFQLIGLFIPKTKIIIKKYRAGSVFAPAIISFSSGTLFSILITAFVYKNAVRDFPIVLLFPIFFILIGLAGWLILVKQRDYEQKR